MQMSGGFEYNMTTESQFQQMKQKYEELQEENYVLKKSLQELIAVNNQLTQTLEQFNQMISRYSENQYDLDQSALVQFIKNQISPRNRARDDEDVGNNNQLSQDKSNVIQALEGLIQSFKQTQRLYQQQISSICEELDQYRDDCEEKLSSYEDMYVQKLNTVQELIKSFKKKEEIVAIVTKKIQKEEKSPTKPKKKINELQNGNHSSYDNKSNGNGKYPDYHKSEQLTRYPKNQQSNQNHLKMKEEIDYLKEKQKKFIDQINQKNKIINVYTQMIAKMKKKITEKY